MKNNLYSYANELAQVSRKLAGVPNRAKMLSIHLSEAQLLTSLIPHFFLAEVPIEEIYSIIPHSNFFQITLFTNSPDLNAQKWGPSSECFKAKYLRFFDITPIGGLWRQNFKGCVITLNESLDELVLKFVTRKISYKTQDTQFSVGQII